MKLLAIMVILVVGIAAYGGDTTKNPIEAGNVRWGRDLDAAGHDVIPRKDRVWTTGGVASRMVEALEAANRPVPKYLEDLAISLP